MFLTQGPVGGHVRLVGPAGEISRELPQRPEPSLRYWKDDPRYDQWMKEPRFRYFIHPDALAQAQKP